MDPCGYAVDMLRSCYRTRFLMVPGQPLVPVRWYFADNKQFVAHATSFNVNAWDSDHTRRPIGDQFRRHQFHGNDWVDGSGPAPGCCPEPFGGPDAWRLGGLNQPTKLSCDWISVFGMAAEASGAVGTISVVATYPGVAQEAETATGTAQVVVNVPGIAQEAETATGTAQVVVNVPGIAQEAETATGTAQVVVNVPGIAQEAETATGTAVVVVQAAGAAAEAETASGDLTFIPAPPVNPIITTCIVCSAGTYTYWYLTLSGISGSTDCTNLNGSWTFSNGPGSCQWQAYYSPGVVAMSFGINVVFSISLNIVDPSGNPLATYSCPVLSYNCLGPSNVFTLVSSPSCSGWPGTITLTSS